MKYDWVEVTIIGLLCVIVAVVACLAVCMALYFIDSSFIETKVSPATVVSVRFVPMETTYIWIDGNMYPQFSSAYYDVAVKVDRGILRGNFSSFQFKPLSKVEAEYGQGRISGSTHLKAVRVAHD